MQSYKLKNSLISLHFCVLKYKIFLSSHLFFVAATAATNIRSVAGVALVADIINKLRKVFKLSNWVILTTWKN